MSDKKTPKVFDIELGDVPIIAEGMSEQEQAQIEKETEEQVENVQSPTDNNSI